MMTEVTTSVKPSKYTGTITTEHTERSDSHTISSPKTGGLIGWICPICWRGVSPFTTVCPCKTSDKGWEVTF